MSPQGQWVDDNVYLCNKGVSPVSDVIMPTITAMCGRYRPTGWLIDDHQWFPMAQIGIIAIVHLTSNIKEETTPDNKIHGANMGPTWVLSVPDGRHVGPTNLTIRECVSYLCTRHPTPTHHPILVNFLMVFGRCRDNLTAVTNVEYRCRCYLADQTDTFAKAEIKAIEERNFSNLHPNALVYTQYRKTTKSHQVSIPYFLMCNELCLCAPELGICIDSTAALIS